MYMVKNIIRKKEEKKRMEKENWKFKIFCSLKDGVYLNHLNDGSKMHIFDLRTPIWVRMSEFPLNKVFLCQFNW